MSRILIAEDQERISRFIEKGLRAAGFVPTVVTDGVTVVDYALITIGVPGDSASRTSLRSGL